MRAYLIIIILFLSIRSYAQDFSFLTSGKIEFERRINTYPIYEGLLLDNKNIKKENLQKSLNDFKSANSQFNTASFSLTFDKTKSLYQPELIDKKSFLSGAAFDNIVFNEFEKNQFSAQKNLFGEALSVRDTLGKIKWRLTDEVREIAGFHCRRANASLADSVYVVAFYTDQIPVKSGPEMFQGLPGMILSVSLPYEHITWQATKVSADSQVASELEKKIIIKTPMTKTEYFDKFQKTLNQFNLTSKWFKSFLTY